MRRFTLLLAAFTLPSCAKEPAPPAAVAVGTFAGAGRDRLCVAGEGGAQRAGLIAYGADETNCTASGRLDGSGATLTLIPAGDRDCKIPLSISGDTVRVGTLPASCAYYCGPGAALSGKEFTRAAQATPAVDLAGDPLC